MTREVVPACSPEGRSWTRMPCRSASRPTTNRPMRWETEASTVGGLASLWLMSAKSSGVSPMPLSWISIMTRPSGSRVAATRTLVCGEENVVAFSSSSESRCTRSVTALPWMSPSGTPDSSIRSYASTSDVAARSTSISGTGWFQRRPGSSPARMRRFSPLRLIRVARWSIRKRLSSWSGSASLFSSSVIRVS